MAESALAKKMKLKEGHVATIINAPQGYLQELQPLPAGVKILQKVGTPSDWIQLFVKSKAEIDELFPKAVKLLKPAALLWICFPKGTSKIQTDLTRDKGWDVVAAANLKWVTLVSINDLWSAFAVRLYNPAKQNRIFDK